MHELCVIYAPSITKQINAVVSKTKIITSYTLRSCLLRITHFNQFLLLPPTVFRTYELTDQGFHMHADKLK